MIPPPPDPNPGAMRGGSAADPNTSDDPETLAARTAAAVPDTLLADLAAAFADRYELGDQLGEGGFGAVYQAFDRRLNRAVAVKVSRPELMPAREAERLLEEARQLAQLRHPGIVTVHDVAAAGERWFIVSELLTGPTLSGWLKSNRPTWAEAAEIAAQIAEALAHAHARSVIHRDVKPSNVILTEGRRPVLVDFGIALSDLTPDTRRAETAGTPAYMSPEQARGLANRPDGRTDVYSLGATLYELLCGRPPFRSDDMNRLLRMVREEEPQPPRQLRPEMPVELERVCLRSLAKSPADRFTTAADFAAALRRAVEDKGAQPPASTGEWAPGREDRPTRDEDRRPTLIPPLVPEPPPAPVPSQPERRQITVLYGAIEPDPADADAAHDQFVAFRDTFRTAVTGFDGLTLPAAGTACLACFGYPTAREDAPRLAVRAALAVRSGLAAWPGATARVAVHTGPAVVTQPPDGPPNVVGDVATAVARLDTPARVDGVLVSDVTFRLVEGFFDCESAGEVRLRSSGPPAPVFLVTAERDARNRVDAAGPDRLTPLVGRDREVGLLNERWELATEGVGHVVLLVADPGLGKSRLVRVIREHVQSGGQGAEDRGQRAGGRGQGKASGGRSPAASSLTSDFCPLASERPEAVIEWYCSPYHQDSPLHPATDYFTRAFGLHREPDPVRRLGRLADCLRDDGITEPDRVALFASALSVPFEGLLPPLNLSADRRKERTREVVVDWLRTRAARHPVLFVVEDLHWVDPSTEELLGEFVEQSADSQVLGVFTYRPEYEPPWKAKTDQTRIALTRLSRRQVADLIRAQSGRDDIPSDVIDHIADRTDGVPLFVEEVARSLTENGRGVAEAIPATLQDLLLARLDRMASNKDVVQLGAAIDRTFSHEMIRAASALPEPALRAELNKLVAAGVLVARGSPPRGSYTFKHALIQDAAYQSMVKKRRQEVHRAVAAAIERHFPEMVDTHPELLAHHHTEAGLAREGIDGWLRAGLRARDRSAHPEAIRHLSRGLVLLAQEPSGPDRDARELAFRMPLTASCVATRGYASPEVEAQLQTTREVCERVGPSAPRFHMLMVGWAVRLIQGRVGFAEEVGRALLGLAEVADDDGMRTEAHWAAGCAAWWAGEFAAARRHLQRADLLYRIDASVEHARYTQQNAGPLLLAYEGLALWMLGLPEQAQEKVTLAVAVAEDLNHPFTLAGTLWVSALLATLAGETAEALAWADRVIELSDAQSFVFWAALGAGVKGAALAHAGRDTEAVPLLRDSIARVEATGCEKFHQHSLWVLSGCLWRLGQRDEAWAALKRAFAINDRERERFLEAELHRRQAQFLLEQPDRNEYDATICLVRAVEVARQQYARFFDLRASVDLARLWARSRPGEARDLLGPAIDGFTEGHDSPDLIAARAVLEQLG